MNQVTQLLAAAEKGDQKAAEDLLPLVYDELRRLAASKLSKERPGQTLQATALVHDAWLRVAGPRADGQKWDGRGHFFGAAAEAMRRILVDSARRKKSQKRGGDRVRVDLDLDRVELAIDTDEDHLIAVSEALEKLGVEDPSAAELVKLRFFAGLTNREAAEVMGVSERNARRWWDFARTWLFHEIKREI
jgi:RNA polymerase sigma factor (TIGR02999 family)